MGSAEKNGTNIVCAEAALLLISLHLPESLLKLHFNDPGISQNLNIAKKTW